MGASGRHEIDVEQDGSRRSNSGKDYVYPNSMDQPGMVPRSREERRHFVFLIPFFVIANIVVFIVTMYYNNCPEKSDESRCILRWLGRFSFQPWRENPLLGPSSRTLLKMGGLERQEVIHSDEGWRLVSCMWLHAGVFHLLANMIGLLLIGLNLERECGFIKVGIVYLVSGFGGSLLSALFLPENIISVGASGALFGLLGASISDLIINWSRYADKCLALWSLVVIVAVNLAFGLMPHVDNFAHIGGFVGGLLLGFVFLVKPQYGWVNLRDPRGEVPVSKYSPMQYVLFFLSLVLLIAGYTAATVALFKDVNANEKCSWCHYLSCVPTSRWKCDNRS